MDVFTLVIVVIILSLAVILGGMLISAFGKKGATRQRRLHGKDHAQILKEANRRLAQNPRDIDAHKALGDVYYNEQDWEKAYKEYVVLMELSASHPEINDTEINKRYGLCALKLNKLDDAYKGLMLAHSANQNDFEVHYNIGYLEFIRKQYEKAVFHLRTASRQNPEHAATLRHLGLALFKLKQYKDALTNLKRSLDVQPDDKESLFAMGECFYELGQQEQAMRIFTHLRTEPQLGPSASLFAGTIHLNQRQFQKAIVDFEIGLKHSEIKPELALEIKYRLATAYLKEQEISKAVNLLNDIMTVAPDFKDVAMLLSKYKELNSSRNLQIYLLSSTSDFITLCRKLALSFFPKAKIKITNISIQKNDWADLLVEVETSRWSDVVLFRMIRSNGTIGELTLRDFHAKIKELKAGRGYCLTSGTFSDEAKRFVEARLIDLIEKDKLLSLLNTVDSREKGLLIQD